MKTSIGNEIIGISPLDLKSQIPLTELVTLLSCGFPNPGEELFRNAIHINDILKLHPTTTFVGTAWSDSMEKLIYQGARLIIDTSLEIKNGNLVAAAYDGEWVMKRFWKDARGVITLNSENPAYPPVRVREDLPFRIFGKIRMYIQEV